MTSGEVSSPEVVVQCPQQHGLGLRVGHREICCFEIDHNDGHHVRKALLRFGDDICVVRIQHTPN